MLNIYNLSLNSINHRRNKKRSILQNYETYVNDVDVHLNHSQSAQVRRIQSNKMHPRTENKKGAKSGKVELIKNPLIRKSQLKYSILQNKNKNFYSDKKTKKMESMRMVYSHCDLEVRISQKNSYEKQESNQIYSNFNSYESLERKIEILAPTNGAAFIENCQIVNFVETSPGKKWFYIPFFWFIVSIKKIVSSNLYI